VIEVRLPYREPFDGEALLAFLRARAVAGLESVAGSTYRRVLSLGRGGGVVELTPHGGAVLCRLRLDDVADRAAAIARCRRLLDLDCDPGPVVAHLGSDPVLGPLVRRRPGLRVPGCVDGFELAVRAIVGQQVSVAGARTVLGRLVARYGDAARGFPTPATLARVDPATLPFPRARGQALRSLARLVAAGELALDTGADPRQVRATLLGIRGIGPWTASYIAMRALGDPDAWLPGDAGVRHALERLGQPTDAPRVAEAWRPWRSYAVMHLWTELGIEPQRPIARSASG
jgi:AraC family transcriptional regulator of adaptative response / DNA-3-methyladenine glycosylase II